MNDQPRPPIDPSPLCPYVAWAGNRNKDPILAVFKEIFPKEGDALELASGSGLHVTYFAPHFPTVRFQPSDYDVTVFDSIREKRDDKKLTTVADPIRIDLTDKDSWPDAAARLYDVIFVINIFQVAPLSIADGIFALGEELLKPSGEIAIYGPFKVDGAYTTPSNQAFDGEILAAGVAEWGLKDVRDLEKSAKAHGLALKSRIDMPANNFILLFGRP
ncbi:protein of unknown function DUF938 [Methylocella silvestris BL2]|uniref:SAM-dependent methyltransferase n=1 Tax=Methylocella silvestris (strain DSM 15510 / CIP 108128 / LMG 27833 / NCIMB 13906 / BL2) TaxID=395965 RepID=B8EM18_METSB|nr:DUF938 domain-containing protein [Methylocella silvestris]ACK51407.1 protein of unknown function DUF938 [Methylocella silvestris BL2]